MTVEAMEIPTNRGRRLSIKCLDSSELAPVSENLTAGFLSPITSQQQPLEDKNNSSTQINHNRRRSISFLPTFNLNMEEVGCSPMFKQMQYSSKLSAKPTPNWEPTLQTAVQSIVSIRANHVRSFDTESSGSYCATGFIVDAKLGLLLTNRHVVSPAPIVAQGILPNYEEVELLPIYRDPVHDFGFLKFDPKKVQFMELRPIKLAPHKAKVGLDIRVVGNNAGEKLSILAGTLARLDRKAPDYGKGEFNDFNTFYLQAASGTSGGSSGSPVLDIEGDAIALNAGGSNKASSSYYLPLDRVQRALKLIQSGKPVTRGTLQTEFLHLPYDEVRRLGMPKHLEREVRQRFKLGTGLLVASQILPEGPADKIIFPGDIVYKLQNELIESFINFFAILDESVNHNINLKVIRNGKLVDLTLKVQDLHLITPDKFVEVGGGILNSFSYQLARSYNLPTKGVYVASSGHMLGSATCYRDSIVLAVNHIPTPDLESFVAAVQTLPDGARVPIRFFQLRRPGKEKVMIMHVDRHWNPFKVATRDDVSGKWNFEVMPPPPSVHSYTPSTAILPKLLGNGPETKVVPAIVTLDFHIPYLIDGMKGTQFYGSGLIIDSSLGLVVCDRDTVPIGVGDIFVTFASSVVIPGKLKYLHPTYNLAVIAYDVSLIGDTVVHQAELDIDGSRLKVGDDVTFVGVGADHTSLVKKTKISGRDPVSTKECTPPRWRATNVEGLKLEASVSSQGGVLCDDNGKVKALWVNYSYQDDSGKDVSVMQGLDVHVLKPILYALQNGDNPTVNSLEVEFWTIRLAAARTLGLDPSWVHKVELNPDAKQSFLYVLNITNPDAPAFKLLKTGDLVLEANGHLMTSIADLRHIENAQQVEMTVLRDGTTLHLTVGTLPLNQLENQQLISWAGALIQLPSRAVIEQVNNVPQGVYVACTLFGSPVNTFGLKPGVWITQINETDITNMQQFLDTVLQLETKHNESNDGDNEEEQDGYVRITTISRSGDVKVLTLKLDLNYWPTWKLDKDDSQISGWLSTRYG